MTHDKGRSTETNEETKDAKLSGALNQTSHCTGNRSRSENNSHQNSCSVFIAKRTIHKAHEDGTSHRANVGSPNLLLGKVKCDLDFGQKWSNGKPDEEGSEETHPTEVEGPHVRSLEGEELDFLSLVILAGIDLDVVCIIFLPFGGFSSRYRHD